MLSIERRRELDEVMPHEHAACRIISHSIEMNAESLRHLENRPSLLDLNIDPGQAVGGSIASLQLPFFKGLGKLVLVNVVPSQCLVHEIQGSFKVTCFLIRIELR